MKSAALKNMVPGAQAELFSGARRQNDNLADGIHAEGEDCNLSRTAISRYVQLCSNLLKVNMPDKRKL